MVRRSRPARASTRQNNDVVGLRARGGVNVNTSLSVVSRTRVAVANAELEFRAADLDAEEHDASESNGNRGKCGVWIAECGVKTDS